MGRGKSWARHEDTHVVELRNQGYTPNMIAAVVDRSPKAIKERLLKLSKKGNRILGYDNTKKKPEPVRYTVWGARLSDELREQYNAGVPMSQMVLRYDDDERVPQSVIQSKVKAMRKAGELPVHRENRHTATTLRKETIKVKAFAVLDEVFLNTTE